MDYQFLKYVAICQGAFVLGLSVVIFYFYFRYTRRLSALQVHILTVTLSYMLLLTGTIISVDRAVYDWGDIWFYIIGLGYLLGDISLVVMFRMQVKKHYGSHLDNKID